MEETFDVKDFLYSEIGLEEPRIRRVNLFKKLIRLYDKHGAVVVRIMADVWNDCCTVCERSTPSRMFCRCIKLRLQEAGLWHEERKFDGMSIAEILASGVFKRRAKMPLFEEDDPARIPPRPGHHRRCQDPKCNGCQ